MTTKNESDYHDGEQNFCNSKFGGKNKVIDIIQLDSSDESTENESAK